MLTGLLFGRSAVVFAWLRKFFAESSDFDPDPARGRIGPALIRPYREEDFEACRQLYILNEPGRFPDGTLPEFKRDLQGQTTLFLVAEVGGQIWGCGGVSIRSGIEETGHLSFGLVHPEHQGGGLGTALLLARLSLLPTAPLWVFLIPVPSSRTFYERFGFQEGQRATIGNGDVMPVLRSHFSPDAQSGCIDWLANAGVKLVTQGAVVPVNLVSAPGSPVRIPGAMSIWLRRFTHPQRMVDSCSARGRMQPCRVRAYTPTDFDRCVELYRKNELGRFPPGILPEFEKSLSEGQTAYLVMEEEGGQVIGCGGITVVAYPQVTMAHLCFGLIDPERHGQGWGSTLLLARLTLLPPALWQVSLQAVPKSQSFYERFGFCFFYRAKVAEGEDYMAFHAFLSVEERALCRALLTEAGVDLQTEGVVVPKMEMAGQAA